MDELKQFNESVKTLGNVLGLMQRVEQLEKQVKELADYKAACEQEAEEARKFDEERHRNFEDFMRRRKEQQEEDARQQDFMKGLFV